MKRRAHSLRGRLFVTVAVVAALCIVMLAVTSYRTIGAIEQSRLLSSILSDARQMRSRQRQEYLTLIHISQQMMPEGSIGVHMNGFLTADNQYGRIVSSRSVSENLNLATFANPQVELVMYYGTAGGELYVPFSNLNYKRSFDPNGFTVLSATPDIRFHASHEAVNRINNAQVNSIIRKVRFTDGSEMFIYIEARATAGDTLREMSSLQNMSYSLVQTNINGEVRYSESPEYPVGSVFDFSGAGSGYADTGRSNGYVWGASEEIFGFINILLVPDADYDRQINIWQAEIIVEVLVASALVFFISRSLYKQFYTPLRLLNEEMKNLGQGDFSQREFNFSIREYEIMFAQFNKMKKEITGLVFEVCRKEKENARLELDKLYYQINPHFLMNSLNSARWQAAMEGQSALADYLSRLNFMLGYTLGKVNKNTTLRTEIEVTKAYLKLQHSRHDFELHLDIEEGTYLEQACARLILQPVAENSVCHNINDFGNLWLTVRDTGGNAVIEIRDDGAGFEPKPDFFKEPPEKGGEREVSRGIGLRYVWLSISSFYGGDASMTVESAPNKGTAVTLTLPYRVESGGE